MPRPLYHWEKDPAPIVQEAGWPSGLLQTPGHPAHSESQYVKLRERQYEPNAFREHYLELHFLN